jgi:sugar/nucleoside kinase (ribokinase family)
MPADSRALVFGDLIDDIIVVPSGPIRSDTDTASSIRSQPGGSAANTAAWMAAAGADVTFVGRCAAVDAARHAQLLESAGSRARITVDETLPTGAIIVIVEGDRRSMLTERGANAALSPDDVDPAGFTLVHATGYSVLGHEEEFVRLVDRAHAAGARVSLNAGSVAAIDDVGVEAFTTATAGADIVIATTAEAALLSGQEQPDAAARALAERHGVAAVTAGRDGAWACERGGIAVHVPAVVVDAVDPTGAGDSFSAGFLSALLRGEPPAVAAAAGAALAARAVCAYGARPPTLTL